MKRIITKQVVDGSPRYYVKEKKNIFSKWKDVKFSDEDGVTYDYLEDPIKVYDTYWDDIDRDSEIYKDYRKEQRKQI